MKYLGRFLALMAALLLIPSACLAAWTFSVTSMLLDADTYKNAFSRQDFYTSLIPAAIPVLAQEGWQGPGETLSSAQTSFLEIIRDLDPQDWAAIAADLTPEDWLRRQFETNLDAYFAWLNYETSTLNISIDTATLRDRLSGEPGQRAINRIIQSWPPCTDTQIETLRRLGTIVGAAMLPHCRPPGEYLATTSETLSAQLRSIVQEMPDTLPDPERMNDPQTRAQLERMRQDVRLGRGLVIELLLLPLALLSLIIFFTVRSLKSFGRWTGWTLILGGILTAVPIPLFLSPFLMSPFATSIAMSVETNNITAGGQAGIGSAPAQNVYLPIIFEGIIRSVVAEMTLPVLLQAAAVIGLGFIALVIAAVSRYPEEAEAEEYYTMTMSAFQAQTGMLTPVTPITPTGQYPTGPPSQARSGTPPGIARSGVNPPPPERPPEEPKPPV